MPKSEKPKSEKEIQSGIMVALSNAHCLIWRNTIGMLKDAKGHFIRYGIGGAGGSDLLGYLPIHITADMVGRKMGIFVAVEVKRPGKKPTPEQENFLRVVRENGGLAGMATSVEEALSIINSSQICISRT